MWETASYVVTVIGLPTAIVFYAMDRWKQREQEDEETYLHLSDEYVKFLKLALENADLRLLDPQATPGLDAEQKMRKSALLGILISLFERAYILIYTEKMSGAAGGPGRIGWPNGAGARISVRPWRRISPARIPNSSPICALWRRRIRPEKPRWMGIKYDLFARRLHRTGALG